jgi:hypothetical protein
MDSIRGLYTANPSAHAVHTRLSRRTYSPVTPYILACIDVLYGRVGRLLDTPLHSVDFHRKHGVLSTLVSSTLIRATSCRFIGNVVSSFIRVE